MAKTAAKFRLKGLKYLSDGHYEDCILAGVDYNGKLLAGFFSKRHIHKGKLEVDVKNCSQDWAWVKPRGGYFIGKRKGVAVRLENIENLKQNTNP